MATLSLTQMEYIVTVAEHGHFGNAAAECGVTQPTLSMQIGKAESALGVVLFDRARQPVVPTDVGARVVAQARVVLRETARLHELCQEPVGGTLRVGVLPTLGPYLLPRLLPTLQASFPGLRLHVEELLTDTLLARLRAETLDVALIATPAVAADLLQWPLFREPLVGYVSRRHTLAGTRTLHLHDIDPADLWLLSEAHCLGQQTRELCRLSGELGAARVPGAPAVRFESGSLEMLKQMVEHGGGVTLLPALCVDTLMDTHPAAGPIPLAPPVPGREVSLVARRAFVKQFLIEAFVNTLLAALPPTVEHAVAGPWRIRPIARG